jgi:Protein of unknown function (DUF1579)
MRRVTFLRGLLACILAATAMVSTSQAQLGPGPEHAKLKELVGDWDCVVKMGGTESKGSATYRLDMGGMWVISEFKGEFGGQSFKGMGIDGYDQTKKKYTGVWVDSMTSAPMVSEGTYDSTGKILTMTGEQVGPDGKMVKNKMTSEMKSPDLMLFTMYMVGADGKETPMMTIEYKRKK